MRRCWSSCSSDCWERSGGEEGARGEELFAFSPQTGAQVRTSTSIFLAQCAVRGAEFAPATLPPPSISELAPKTTGTGRKPGAPLENPREGRLAPSLGTRGCAPPFPRSRRKRGLGTSDYNCNGCGSRQSRLDWGSL